MKGMTKIAMGAALAVALSLAMLLALLLFLLVSLFCSLIRDKRHQHRHQHNLPQFRNDENKAKNQSEQIPRPLTFPFYAHGVLKAPTNYLLTVPNLEAAMAKQTSSPSSSHSHHHHHGSSISTAQFVYISNPIYDGEQSTDDQFVTPKAEADNEVVNYNKNESENSNSPPLKLMKKLPAVLPKLSSVATACLFEGQRSLGASTATNMPSSSSSNSLCSSPSW